MPKYSPPIRRFLFILALFSFATVARADDWPHWRGLSRNGNVGESSRWTGGSWPPDKAVWCANVNPGSSGPIVIGNRLYTMGWKENQDHVYCIDASRGQIRSTNASTPVTS